MSMQKELVSKVHAMMRERYGGTGPEALQALFADYDADDNGVIDGDELERILADAAVGSAISRRFWVRGVFARYDKDRSGTIDPEELARALAERESPPPPPPDDDDDPFGDEEDTAE